MCVKNEIDWNGLSLLNECMVYNHCSLIYFILSRNVFRYLSNKIDFEDIVRNIDSSINERHHIFSKRMKYFIFLRNVFRYLSNKIVFKDIVRNINSSVNERFRIYLKRMI